MRYLEKTQGVYYNRISKLSRDYTNVQGLYSTFLKIRKIQMKLLCLEVNTFVSVKGKKYCHSVVINIASIIYDDLFYPSSHTQNNKLQS